MHVIGWLWIHATKVLRSSEERGPGVQLDRGVGLEIASVQVIPLACDLLLEAPGLYCPDRRGQSYHGDDSRGRACH